MKKSFSLRLVAMLLSVGFFATSCDKDKDDVVPNPDNTEEGNTQYNGEQYNIKNGFYIDGGTIALFEDEDTHYATSLMMTDGTPTFDDAGKVSKVKNGKILIISSLFSAGDKELKSGTYHFADLNAEYAKLGDEDFIEKYTDRSFFINSTVVIDSDNDGNWQEETQLKVKEGTMKVSGELPNITAEYDFTMLNGKKLKGKFTGKFNEIEVDDEEGEQDGVSALSKITSEKNIKW